MKYLPLKIILCGFASLWGTSTYAQINCSSSLSECVKEIAKSEAKKLASNFELDESQKSKLELFGKLIGANGFDSSFANTTKNFLPLLSSSGILGSNGDDEKSGEILIDLNQALGKEDNNFQAKVLIDTDADLSASVIEAIPAGIKDSLSSTLADEIGGSDDINLSLSYNHVTETMGRNISAYHKYFSPLAKSVLKKTQPSDIDALKVGLIFGKFLQKVQNELGFPDVITLDSDMSVFGDKQAEAEEILRRLVAADDAALNDLSNTANEYKLSSFSNLVNNQPQLHFSISNSIKDNLVGADELSIKFTYERGFHNLNTYRKSCEMGNLDCYKNYMDTYEPKLLSADRLALSIEYIDIDSYSVSDLPSSFAFTQPSTEKVVVSAGYGRTIGPIKQPSRQTRLVANLDIEKFLGSSEGNDRVVFSVTAIRKVGNFSIPFGLTYANKSEFLDDSDTQLSAHVAVKFDITAL